MKHSYIPVLLLFIFFLTGCNDDKKYLPFIDRAESLLITNPDSSLILLDSITVPDNLSDKQLARWCMLYGELADTLFVDLPYVQQLERADTYYKSHGTVLEQARIGLYLGRAYVDDENHEKAMKAYLHALEIARESESYNQAGYICSYMGDLYDSGNNEQEAVNKYRDAERYFRKAGNLRSATFALRDMGRMYAFSDSLELALDIFLQADTIAIALNDSILMSSINNGLGNIYKIMGNLNLAETYLLLSMRQDSSDIIPDYCALSGVYIKKREFDKAREYLHRAEMSSDNEETRVSILYSYYQIEKEEGEFDNALNYFECFHEITDSIRILENKINISKVEKEYNHLKISLENVSLHSEKQMYFILWMIFVCISLCLLFLYYYITNRKNKILHKQQLDILQKDKILSLLKQDLQSKQDELRKFIENKQLENEQIQSLKCIERQKEIEILYKKIEEQQHELLFSSLIFKKAIKLSNEIVPGRKESPLTKRDWKSLRSILNEVYPLLSDQLLNFGMTDGEMDYCYLSFLMLDTNREAVLLNIMPDSVNKIRQRIRKKLEIVGESIDIHSCLLKCVIKH